jgi:muramoyltetrapeptide carboxypeptidase
MLTQLRNAGKLDRIAGVVIGEMYKCEEHRQPEPWLRSRSMEDVFEHHLEPLGVPILHNLPLGHGDHLCTIPLGVAATVDADARTLIFAEPALETKPARSRRDPSPVASR